MSCVKPILLQDNDRSLELNKVFNCLDTYLSTDRKTEDPAIYVVQRAMIDKLFSEQKEGEERWLLLLNRLTLLDALYSTSVSRYHAYAMVDIAKAIDALGTDDEYVEALAAWLDDLDDSKAKGLELFDKTFGALSDDPKEKWERGSRAVSLLSKYSYYLFRQPKYKKEYPSGFPIYDSLAKESYARVIAYIDEGAKPKRASNEIVNYLKAIKALGTALWGSDEEYLKKGYSLQRFDLLDTYLWRLGKFSKASYSLLLGREDYAKVKELQVQDKEASLESILPQIKDELFKTIYKHYHKNT